MGLLLLGPPGPNADRLAIGAQPNRLRAPSKKATRLGGLGC